MFNVICPQFSVFAVKLANFLMFTVSEENTVKCSEGSSDIFGNGRTSSLVFGNLRQSSGIVGSVRKSCEKIRNCCKKTPWYSKQNIIGLFCAVFASFWKKITVSKKRSKKRWPCAKEKPVREYKSCDWTQLEGVHFCDIFNYLFNI